MMPMNNLFASLIQLAQQGGNPMQALSMYARQNPMVAQVMQMTNGKDAEQLRTMAENMCRERGTTPEQVAQSMGFVLPK